MPTIFLSWQYLTPSSCGRHECKAGYCILYFILTHGVTIILLSHFLRRPLNFNKIHWNAKEVISHNNPIKRSLQSCNGFIRSHATLIFDNSQQDNSTDTLNDIYSLAEIVLKWICKKVSNNDWMFWATDQFIFPTPGDLPMVHVLLPVLNLYPLKHEHTKLPLVFWHRCSQPDVLSPHSSTSAARGDNHHIYLKNNTMLI